MRYHLRLSSSRLQDSNEDATKNIKRIKRAVSGLKSKKEIAAYIKQQQIDFIQYRASENNSQVDEILFFLETYFGAYLDKSQPISSLGKSKLIETLSFLHKVRDEFKSLNTFLEKVLWPILYPEKHKDFSIHQAEYLLYLHSKWVNEFIPSHPDYNERELLRFLISSNYNTYSFFNYITKQVDMLYENETNNDLKLTGLKDYLSQVSRIPLCVNLGFSQEYPSIKIMLKEWLEDEIKKCSKEIKKNKPEKYITDTKHKFEVDLSVDQMAYLTKLFYTSKIITNKSQLEVIQLVKKVIRTKGSNDISFNSLNNKYYNVEDKTKESVRIILQTMLKQIQ